MSDSIDNIGKDGFEAETRMIPISSIVPLKVLSKDVKKTQKYRQIAASVKSVGLIEPPVVFPDKKRASFYLLDGMLRIEVMKDLGLTEVECLISTDDEGYSYNKQINRLSVVQEHRMIVRAVEQGASEEAIAAALNLSVATIHQRFRMLAGLCGEVVALLSDKPCTMVVLRILKKMKPLRQMQAAELIVGQGNYSTSFALAILGATSDDQLVEPKRGRQGRVPGPSREQIGRLERELATAQQRTRFVEETYGVDNLCLTVAQSYLAKLLSKNTIHRWLSKHHSDYLSEFQSIVALSSLSVSSDSPRT
ncbi:MULTISPECIES: plasmid partitioning protein RepB C-terminal domain-containing protein [unclassified Lysobacter]|uniref:plasmid partitioning protein RepB C-terminal domain-containing protein n=1 Tax=unclassified Lysobacter TaxID=2635362 RepID=UPI001BE5DCD0|nr:MULTISPECIES: plasmid partitioning protein RepB C-terminal domain-containing protein [unclassified Lysobacter]MBT2748273.1 ParB N-terminal domain-containing protein [Lysobacter sp. ISL-42]MBT2749960.1 ParB N-terminal domain-containing protein [Lysobacter sp. ISL-50]MBT2781288.1 ParB N-terminal domain-containing protein [Lysobacter sp. ISL-52]